MPFVSISYLRADFGTRNAFSSFIGYGIVSKEQLYQKKELLIFANTVNVVIHH